jgi:H+/Cl- antiporter ClcA
MRSLFRKVWVKNARVSHGVRILIAVLLGGTVSLLAVGAMGGGHDLIEKIGSGSATRVDSAFGLSLVWSLLIILILRFIITSVNVGSGIPCGIFIPMIAMGACLGALLNQLWLRMGMDDKFCDLMVMICMAAFFTTVVKAPITSIVMICEFTGSFAHLLPVVIAVACAYIIGQSFRTDGIYEELLEQYEEETGVHERTVREVFTFTLAQGALADKREVRDVLWPAGAKVAQITRGEERILPDGKTLLRGGDVLTIEVKSDEPEMVKDELSHILD